MPTKHRREGYLLTDHRNSPCVPEEMIRASGRNAPVIASGQIFESPTVTCAHCNVVVVLNPDRTRPRGYCRKCDQYVCDNPACNAECTPAIKNIDDIQE